VYSALKAANMASRSSSSSSPFFFFFFFFFPPLSSAGGASSTPMPPNSSSSSSAPLPFFFFFFSFFTASFFTTSFFGFFSSSSSLLSEGRLSPASSIRAAKALFFTSTCSISSSLPSLPPSSKLIPAIAPVKFFFLAFSFTLVFRCGLFHCF